MAKPLLHLFNQNSFLVALDDFKPIVGLDAHIHAHTRSLANNKSHPGNTSEFNGLGLRHAHGRNSIIQTDDAFEWYSVYRSRNTS